MNMKQFNSMEIENFKQNRNSTHQYTKPNINLSIHCGQYGYYNTKNSCNNKMISNSNDLVNSSNNNTKIMQHSTQLKRNVNLPHAMCATTILYATLSMANASKPTAQSMESVCTSCINNGSYASVRIGNNSYTMLPDNLIEMDLERDADNWPLERIVSTVVPILFGIMGLAGLLGNALVILVVFANQQMRSTTNLLIINLAASDILFVIFCVPFTATDYVLPEWPFGNIWCKFVQYMIVVTCHCSVYTLVLMSFDRFLAVVHPVSSMSLRTERNAMRAILLAWILIVTTAIPVALAHAVRLYKFRGHNYTACVFSSDGGTWSLQWFQVCFFLSSYVMPLTLISFLYMGMLVRLWRNTPGCKPSAESRKGKRRVTRLVVVVVLAFAICWLPIHIILVLKAFNLYGSNHLTVVMQIISHVLAYMNSCINPILYAFLSDNFRKAFRKVVWCGSPLPVVTNPQITKTTRTTGNGTSNIDML